MVAKVALEADHGDISERLELYGHVALHTSRVREVLSPIHLYPESADATADHLSQSPLQCTTTRRLKLRQA